MYYKLGRAGRALDRFGVVEFATTVAPGVRDVLLTGKVYEATQRNARNKGAIEYDAVVLDAPPTGRITQFLGVNSELSGLAKVGPVKSQADKVMRLLTEARDHAERRALEDAQRELVRGFDVPTYELPRLPGGADLGGLYELAAELKNQGMA